MHQDCIFIFLKKFYLCLNVTAERKFAKFFSIFSPLFNIYLQSINHNRMFKSHRIILVASIFPIEIDTLFRHVFNISKRKKNQTPSDDFRYSIFFHYMVGCVCCF